MTTILKDPYLEIVKTLLKGDLLRFFLISFIAHAALHCQIFILNEVKLSNDVNTSSPVVLFFDISLKLNGDLLRAVGAAL